jgi:hypothetical protein
MRTNRVNRYQGIADTIVQLRAPYASGLMQLRCIDDRTIRYVPHRGYQKSASLNCSWLSK